MRVLVFGTFDGLHPGHRFLLDAASRRGELSVIVARDETVRRIKGFLPAQDEQERAAALQTAYPRAAVVLGDTDDYLKPVLAQRPDRILLGYDQQLPPGVAMEDLPCPAERMPAHEPERYKSSLLRG